MIRVYRALVLALAGLGLFAPAVAAQASGDGRRAEAELISERASILPGETVFTPFMGVGSEVYGAVCAGRRGVGVELKPSYFKQARRNLELAKVVDIPGQLAMSV